MGFFKDSAASTKAAKEAWAAPEVSKVGDAGHISRIGSRKRFVARLPLPADAEGYADVPVWSASIERLEATHWKLTNWSVVVEPSGTCAYAVFEQD